MRISDWSSDVCSSDLEYGTQVVAGTHPKKAGTEVNGVPIYASVAEAVAETGATASCIFIPAPGVKDAVMEAAEGGVEFIVVITEGVPAHDEAWFYNKLQRDFPDVQLLGDRKSTRLNSSH